MPRGCAPPSDPDAVRAGRGRGPGFLLLLTVLAGTAAPCLAAPPAMLDAQIGQLDQLRQQCVAAAQTEQQRERSIGALDMAIGVMTHGVESKTAEIAQSREQQEALLGALERLARAPPEALAFAPEGPVDRMRSAVLIAAAVPALTTQARELGSQLTALSNVQNQLDTRRKEIDDA